jgi:hypothetical protein
MLPPDSGSRLVEQLAGSSKELVYYVLLDQLDREPAAVVSFVGNGTRHVDRRTPKPCSD